MKTIIIEDEERNRVVLQSLIESYCPQLNIVGSAESVRDGINLIRRVMPKLIFMDIQLRGGTGFDILDKLPDLQASIIFTTAYDQYAVKAFKFSAIDYLLKPIDIDELKQAVARVIALGNNEMNEQKFQNLLNNLKAGHEEKPIMLVSTLDSIEFIKINDIVHVEAQGAYSKIHLVDGTSLLASKIIKEFEYLLSDHAFYRVHQSHIINVRYIQKYLKSQNCFELEDGTRIQLARSRKEQFFEILKHIGMN